MRTSGISDHLERWNYSLLFCQVVKGKVPWPRSRKALGAPESSDNFNTMLMIGSQRVNGIFVCIKLLKNRNMTKKSQETFRSVQFLFINSWMGGANSQLKRSNIVESYQKESKKRHFRDLLWTAFHLCISSVKELLECARRKSEGLPNGSQVISQKTLSRISQGLECGIANKNASANYINTTC